MRMLIALSLLPFAIHAEPGPTMQHLMSEPATLFDVGMVRLSSLAAEFEQRVGLSWTAAGGGREGFQAEINSYYEPEIDKIHVGFLIMSSHATYPQMEEGCRSAMRQMDTWLTKSLPDLFSHVGHDGSPPAPGLLSALKESFVLTCYVSSEDDTSKGRFWASQTLVDHVMTIGKWSVSH